MSGRGRASLDPRGRASSSEEGCAQTARRDSTETGTSRTDPWEIPQDPRFRNKNCETARTAWALRYSPTGDLLAHGCVRNGFKGVLHTPVHTNSPPTYGVLS